MPLVRRLHVGDVQTIVPNPVDELSGLADRHTRIVDALHDEKPGADVPDGVLTVSLVGIDCQPPANFADLVDPRSRIGGRDPHVGAGTIVVAGRTELIW